MHGDNVDLIDAATAALEEFAEPGAIGVHEGRRNEFGIWVRCVEKGLQIRSRGRGVFGKCQILEGEVGLIEEFEIWWRVIC